MQNLNLAMKKQTLASYVKCYLKGNNWIIWTFSIVEKCVAGKKKKKKTNPNQGTLLIRYTLQKYQCPKIQRLKNSSKLKKIWKLNEMLNLRYSFAIKGIIGTIGKI